MRITSRLLVLAVSGWLSTGCSWIFMNRAPETVAAPNYPLDCTSNRAPPILDTICAGYFVLNGVGWAVMKDCANALPGETCDTAGKKATGVALSAGLLLLCGASAVTGYGAAHRCEEKKEANARCMNGDAAACQALSPGWTAPAPPLPAPLPTPTWSPPPPPEAPLPAACAKDTDCKGDRVCNRGECVEPKPKQPEPKQPEPIAPKD